MTETSNQPAAEGAEPHDASSQANRMTWFEIASDDPAATKAFYSEVFGWSYVDTQWAWTLINAPGDSVPMGDIWDSAEDEFGLLPSNGITMHIQVEDLEATCERVVEAGGTIVVPPMSNEDGAIRFALIRDVKGNLLAVGRPAAEAG